MSQVDTFAPTVQPVPLDWTIGSSVKAELQGFVTEEFLPSKSDSLLFDPNKNDPDQTQVFNYNGTSNAIGVKIPNLLTKVTNPILLDRFQAMQKWEGTVIEIRNSTFLASLRTIVGEGHYQQAEIYLDEIDEDERLLVEPGAIFYWSIGYLDRPSGRIRASILRFRRLPKWSNHELKVASVEAEKLRGLLDGE